MKTVEKVANLVIINGATELDLELQRRALAIHAECLERVEDGEYINIYELYNHTVTLALSLNTVENELIIY